MIFPHGAWWVGSLDAALAALLTSCFGAAWVAACSQPARRRAIARSTLVVLLLLPALVIVRPVGLFRASQTLVSFYGMIGSSRLGPVLGGAARVGRLLVVVGLGFVALLALARVGLGRLAVRKFFKDARPPSAELSRRYREISEDYRRVPALIVVPNARGPALLGAWRPRLVVPGWFDGPEVPAVAELGLRHELAHVEAGDPAFRGLSAVVGTLWCVLPTVHWLRAQLRIDEEFLADAAASSALGSKGGYATSLLTASKPIEWGGGPSPDRSARSNLTSDLGRRVLMLVRAPRPIERTAPLGWSALAFVLCSVVAVATSALSLGEEPGGEWRPRPDPPAVLMKMDRLVTKLDPPTAGRPTLGYVLNADPPDSFLLEFEIWAEPGELPTYSIMGVPIPEPVTGDGDEDRASRFHRVRFRKSREVVRIEVEGPGPPAQAEASTFRAELAILPPPPYRIRIRDLRLSP